ncbi:MAG: hypothetical protein LUE14_07790 [Clostridiales bacterium]|nr:hypothetical protein [Clostridiales bacterium]
MAGRKKTRKLIRTAKAVFTVVGAIALALAALRVTKFARDAAEEIMWEKQNFREYSGKEAGSHERDKTDPVQCPDGTSNPGRGENSDAEASQVPGEPVYGQAAGCGKHTRT